MAYNNGFPMGYQPVQMAYPQYQQPAYNQQTMTPTIHADIVQVENEDAATRFPVGAQAESINKHGRTNQQWLLLMKAAPPSPCP